MNRRAILLLATVAATVPAAAPALTCRLDFTVVVTRGVGTIPDGERIAGTARFTTTGRSFSQEGGATAFLAEGEMRLGEDIAGPVWTLVTSAGGPTADMMAVFARDVEGLSFAGIDFEGPMALTLYGPPGTLAGPEPPRAQPDWDRLDLRRAFTIAAQGYDMLTATVSDLTATCEN
jgi:hypothetical protein